MIIPTENKQPLLALNGYMTPPASWQNDEAIPLLLRNSWSWSNSKILHHLLLFSEKSTMKNVSRIFSISIASPDFWTINSGIILKLSLLLTSSSNFFVTYISSKKQQDPWNIQYFTLPVEGTPSNILDFDTWNIHVTYTYNHMSIFQGSVDEFLKMLLHSLTPQPPEKPEAPSLRYTNASKPPSHRQWNNKSGAYTCLHSFFLNQKSRQVYTFCWLELFPNFKDYISMCCRFFVLSLPKKTPLSSRHKKHINFAAKKLCFFSTFELPDHEEDLHRIRSFHEHLASTVWNALNSSLPNTPLKTNGWFT